MYGKRISETLSLPEDVVGCHVDIGPTLVELVAPSGFDYHALGNNLFDIKNAKFAINKNYVLSKEFGLLSTQKLDLTPKELVAKHVENVCFSWWRVVKGNLREN